MQTNFIMASATTFKSGVNGYMVYIEGTTPALSRKMRFADILKAMRYCFILKKQTGLKIDTDALNSLSSAYKASKAQPQEEENTAEVVALEAPKKRRGRPAKKNKEEAE